MHAYGSWIVRKDKGSLDADAKILKTPYLAITYTDLLATSQLCMSISFHISKSNVQRRPIIGYKVHLVNVSNELYKISKYFTEGKAFMSCILN